jgi:hypothetical protein
MCLKFGFVKFWQKDFGAKAAHKMLVKLTPGVNSGYIQTLKLRLTSQWKSTSLSYLIEGSCKEFQETILCIKDLKEVVIASSFL